MLRRGITSLALIKFTFVLKSKQVSLVFFFFITNMSQNKEEEDLIRIEDNYVSRRR